MAYLCGKCGCESCDELIDKINEKLARMGNHFVDNLNYELNTPIDKELFRLLAFYKSLLEGMCCGCDCGCLKKDTQKIYERVRILVGKNSFKQNFKYDLGTYPNFNK